MNSLVDLLQKTTKAAVNQGKKLIQGDEHDDDDHHKDKFTQAEYVTVSDEAGGVWFLALFVFLLRLLLLVVLNDVFSNLIMYMYEIHFLNIVYYLYHCHNIMNNSVSYQINH